MAGALRTGRRCRKGRRMFINWRHAEDGPPDPKCDCLVAIEGYYKNKSIVVCRSMAIGEVYQWTPKSPWHDKDGQRLEGCIAGLCMRVVYWIPLSELAPEGPEEEA